MPELTPVRARAIEEADGAQRAPGPFGRDGLVLVAAGVSGEQFPPVAFHRTRVGGRS